MSWHLARGFGPVAVLRRCGSKRSQAFLSTGPAPGKTVILSGIQPTGVPHLGNYLGALQNWTRLQDGWMQTSAGKQALGGGDALFDGAPPSRTAASADPGDTLYSIVDLHSITVPQDPGLLRQNIRETAVSLLAVGLDPEKCTIFQQSRVPQHAELSWILSCQTTMGQLSTMTQWKTKKKKAESQRLGLFAYPVLMAADIMLYKTTHVPVGDDQEQHLELCKRIVATFNNRYGEEFFVHPTPVIGAASRVMDLRDPTSKMSKSARSDNSKINLTDPPDAVLKKIRKAVTDSDDGITYDPVNRKGVANLLEIYVAMDRGCTTTMADVEQIFSGQNKQQFKEAVAHSVIDYLKPIQEEYMRLEADPGYVDQVLNAGADRAEGIAAVTLDGVKALVGFR